MTIQTITLDRLVPSKENVRKTNVGGIEGLAESISAHGLLQNLQVRAVEEGQFEVIAGGRRLAALKLLAKAKRIAADYAVPCHIMNGADAHEISLAENEMRQAMHPADQFDAFKKLVDQGLGEETVAARFGVTPAFVRQRMKLAVVSPKLIALYRKGEMNLEQLMAFTLTDDHKRQEKVWKELPDWTRTSGNDDRIRTVLTEKMVDASRDKLAKFVGVVAYQEAGGQLVRDLFDDESNGYLVNAALLQKLADDMLQEIVNRVAAEGWKWVEAAPDHDYQKVSRYGRIQGTPTKEQRERSAAIALRLQEIEEIDADQLSEAETEALDEEQQKLWAEDEAIEAAAVFSDEDKARAGVLISISRDGEAEIERGYLKPEDVKAAAKAGSKPNGKAAKKPEAPGVSAALVEDLTAHLTMGLQAKMAASPKVALVAVVHSMIVSTTPALHSPLMIVVRGTVTPLPKDVENGAAGREFDKVASKTATGVPKQAPKLWDWLMQQDQKRLVELLAVCAASCIDVIQRKGVHSPFKSPKPLIEALKLDMSAYWQPSAAYFERVSKEQILAAVKETCGGEALVEIAHLKKGELAKRAEKLMAGKKWLPALLR